MTEQQNQKKSPKKQISTKEAKKLLPIIKKMNTATKLLLKIMGQKLTHEQQQVNKIKLMVDDMIQVPNLQSTISITTLDMNATKIKQKGRMGYNKVMDWEKDYRKRNRGTLL